MSLYPRDDPNGYNGEVKLPAGVTLKTLRFGDQLKIETSEGYREAVVDINVLRFFGSPQVAFNQYDTDNTVRYAMLLLVWMEPEGGWQELRTNILPSTEDFLEWRKNFDGENRPLPMPEVRL